MVCLFQDVILFLFVYFYQQRFFIFYIGEYVLDYVSNDVISSYEDIYLEFFSKVEVDNGLEVVGYVRFEVQRIQIFFGYVE